MTQTVPHVEVTLGGGGEGRAGLFVGEGGHWWCLLGFGGFFVSFFFILIFLEVGGLYAYISISYLLSCRANGGCYSYC